MVVEPQKIFTLICPSLVIRKTHIVDASEHQGNHQKRSWSKKQTIGGCSLPSSTELILPDVFLPSQHHDAAGARDIKIPRSSPDEENSKEVEILGEHGKVCFHR